MGISYNSEVCPQISSLMVQRTFPCLLIGNKQLYHKSHCKGMDFRTSEKKQSQSLFSVSFLLCHSPGCHKPQRSIGHGSEASRAASCLGGAVFLLWTVSLPQQATKENCTTAVTPMVPVPFYVSLHVIPCSQQDPISHNIYLWSMLYS